MKTKTFYTFSFLIFILFFFICVTPSFSLEKEYEIHANGSVFNLFFSGQRVAGTVWIEWDENDTTNTIVATYWIRTDLGWPSVQVNVSGTLIEFWVVPGALLQLNPESTLTAIIPD
jgi:hypothetical protein